MPLAHHLHKGAGGCRGGHVPQRAHVHAALGDLKIGFQEADVSALQLNETLRVDMLQVPATIRILTPADETVASVKAVKEEAPAPAEDAADAAAPAADAATAESK